MKQADTYKGHKGNTNFTTTITREGMKHYADNGKLTISVTPMIGTEKGTADYRRKYYSAALVIDGYTVTIQDGADAKRAIINAAKAAIAETPAIPEMEIKRFAADVIGWIKRVNERAELSYIVIDY